MSLEMTLSRVLLGTAGWELSGHSMLLVAVILLTWTQYLGHTLSILSLTVCSQVQLPRSMLSCHIAREGCATQNTSEHN